jgi:hypothetical protein
LKSGKQWQKRGQVPFFRKQILDVGSKRVFEKKVPVPFFAHMRIMILGAVFVPISLLFSSGEAIAQNMQCRDIAKVDFKNIRLELPKGAPIQLKDGKAFSSDDTGDKDSKDWEIVLAQDEMLHPAPARDVRLIKLTRNHLTGSGSWEDIFIFHCVQGQAVRLFQKSFLGGVKIEKKSNALLTLTNYEWMKSDGMCCPSKEREITYQWNEKARTYEEIRDVLHSSKEK